MEKHHIAQYHIKKVWRAGYIRWLVYEIGGDVEVARFNLKREAIDWILKQEKI